MAPPKTLQATLRRGLLAFGIAAGALASPGFAQLANGLTAYWDFDNTLADLAHGNPDAASSVADDLIFLGTDAGFTASGKFGAAYTGGGGDGHAEAADSADLEAAAGHLSISLWFRVNAFDTNWQALVVKGENQNYRLHRAGGNDHLAWKGGSEIQAGGTNVNDGQWHHAVATANDSGSALYIDGALVATGGVDTITDGPNPLMIGENPDAGGRNWNGDIDDLGIWNRALSLSEVQQIWNGGTGASLASLVSTTDSDGDGMTDGWESANGLNPDINDAGLDPDNDNRTNLQEYTDQTDPQNPDTDGDGSNDGAEAVNGTDPTDPDTDDDGSSDGAEVNAGTDPLDPDTDNDNVPDGSDIDPLSPTSDSDGDTVNDIQEFILGTNPLDPDTDGDSLTDNVETNTGTYVSPANTGTDPLATDSDGDGLSDGNEVAQGFDPTDPSDPDNTWGFGLIGYWPLDGGYLDATGNGHDGALAGTNPTGTFATAKFGQGIDLDGVDQRIIVGGNENDFDFTNSSVSISAWFTTGTGFDKSWQALVAKGEGSNWRVARRSTSDVMSYSGGGNGDIPSSNIGPNVNDGGLHHIVAVTEHGVASRIYVDGQLVQSNGGPAIGGNGQPMMIGGNPDTSGDLFRTWRGIIDDVAVWDRPLSDTEVAAIWNGGSGTSVGFLLNPDTDGDGMRDAWEDANGLDKLVNDAGLDPDGDLLVNLDEYNQDSDPQVQDTDADGSDDLAEFNAGTDPNDTDTDDDGLTDGAEATAGTNPLLPDTDGDGLTDGDESNTQGTNPLVADTDGDGAGDGLEIVMGTDPLLNTSTPPAGSVLSGMTSAGTVGAFASDGLPSATPNTSPGANWQVEDYFPSLAFADLKGVVSEPNPDANDGKDYLAVIERRGTLQRVENDRAATVKTQVLDITSNIVYGDNGGLRSLVFHPEYNQAASPNRNYMYAWYTTTINGGFFHRVSRFTRDEVTGVAPSSSELIMIQQRSRDHSQHFGGSLIFGLDGFLYAMFGDLEFSDAGDRANFPFYQDAQRIDRIFQGAMLRLDVDMDPAKSDPPTRTLQGNNPAHPNPVPGTAQSCMPAAVMQTGTLDTIAPTSVTDTGVDFDALLTLGHTYQLEIDGTATTAFILDWSGDTLDIHTDLTGTVSPGANYTLRRIQHNYYDINNFSGVGYWIPKDNYFKLNPPAPGSGGVYTGKAGEHGETAGQEYPYPAHGPALEEYQAIGFRNPWTIAVDPVDGDIAWFIVGSNGGQFTFEEAEVYVPGGNYGWPYREGDQAQDDETNRFRPPSSFAPTFLGIETDPVAFYDHGQGQVGVGGVMYQGTQHPTLASTLVYGDHNSGKIWSVDYKGRAPGTYIVTELIDTNLSIRQMWPSPDQEEILIAANSDIHRLYDASTPNPEPPATLSATGVFTDLATLTPRAGMIPYQPAATLWSDRALKYRWMMIPNDEGTAGEYDQPGEQIIFSESGEWGFPVGTVFVKHFELPLDEGDPANPATTTRLETRFLIHGSDGNYFAFTYKWRPDGTDADLLPEGETSAFSESYTVTREDDSTYSQTWEFPTRAQCFECHQTGAGHVLGVKTRQLNHAIDYPSGSSANQIATLNSLGVFDTGLSVSALQSYITSRNITDESASLEDRVRSYLDSNCSMCHRPEANAGLASFDARLTTPLSLTGIINGVPQTDTFGLTNPAIVVPGDPANSLLYHRDGSVTENVSMPPLAKLLVHDTYMVVLEAWIGRIGLPNFDSWATANGILGGIHDDEDGDGLTNALEFLLGRDGRVAEGGNPLLVGSSGLGVEVSLNLEGDAVADGLGILIEDSADLSAWTPSGSPGSILQLESDSSGPGVDGIQSWSFLPGNRGFARISGVSVP